MSKIFKYMILKYIMTENLEKQEIPEKYERNDKSEKSILNDDDVNQTESGGLLFNPYNPLNKEITLNNIQFILSKYGIQSPIHNIKLYKRAFIHRSYTRRPAIENNTLNISLAERPFDCLPLSTKSNERLEFIGDGVLECITKYYLYRRFPKADEGFMTEKKIALVKNEHIGKLAYEMKLHNYYIISKHAEEKNTRTNLKKLGCLFEAFLGALFLDFNKININDEDGWFQNIFCTGPGFQMAQTFVEKIFETHVDWARLVNTDDNFKNQLQVKIQKEFKTTPDYIEIEHNMEIGYEMGVYLCLGQEIYEVAKEEAIDLYKFSDFSAIHEKLLDGDKLLILLGKGTHKIKKKAEQLACENAIHSINKMNKI
jgi:dsRNA-specific ribonuclease